MKHAENPFKAVMQKSKDLVAQMTLEEKASLCSGLDFWNTKAIERLGISSIMVTDGPHGLRKQNESADHLGINESVPSTCFPTASATACSFDRGLLREVGEAIGEECCAENVAVILGPAANIKRSPLCGRNFEYISEDPYLTGEAAASLICGIQSKNIGTSLKHFLLNNQEKARMVSNSVVDKRAMQEIYLSGFESAVKQSQPWTIMCSYNKINGTYACENKAVLTEILRDEWGFAGAVMTDWGAMDDRVQAVAAGLDLEMPASNGVNDALIVKAVKEGDLDEKLVDLCAQRMTAIALQASQNTPHPYDKEAHNQLARKAALESAVLLKKGSALPAAKTAKAAIIGQFAKVPRYQGAGSSKINPHKITAALDVFEANGISFIYSEGYSLDKDQPEEDKITAAVAAAKKADVVFAFVGLPDFYESEGFDRTHLQMPKSHNKLMEALIAANKNTVAVLSAGSAVEIPWRDSVDSILLMHLAGQNSGEAIFDLLYGDVSPCGKLAETWPIKLEDTPSFPAFGKSGNVEYLESIYVGYRYYHKAQKAVAYPFGFGLSYTQFTYSNLVLDKTMLKEGETLSLTITIKNTGDMAAKEIAQVYVAPPESALFMPVRELRQYEKVFLEPGESKNLTFTLNTRAFSYYNAQIKKWAVQDGSYTIEIGASCNDIRLSQKVQMQSIQPIPVPDYKSAAPFYFNPTSNAFPREQFETLYGCSLPAAPSVLPYNANSTMSDIKNNWIGRILYKQICTGMLKSSGDGELGKMLEAMLEDMPLRSLSMLSNGALSAPQLESILELLNSNTQQDSLCHDEETATAMLYKIMMEHN